MSLTVTEIKNMDLDADDYTSSALSENILQFCSVTGSPPDTAKQYLQVSDGNLELAIQLFLESEGQVIQNDNPIVSPQKTNPSLKAKRRGVIDSEDDGYVVSSCDDEQLASTSKGPTQQDSPHPRYPKKKSSPPQKPPSYAESIDLTQSDLLLQDPPSPQIRRIPPPRLRESSTSSTSFFSTSSRTVADAIRDSNPWENSATVSSSGIRLADLFRPPLELIYRGSLTEARQMATLQCKWILLNLQDMSSFACQCLNRDLWSDQQVKAFIRENFLFLQYTVESPNGMAYLQFYPVAKQSSSDQSPLSSLYLTPHLAIIDPLTGERMKVFTAPLLNEMTPVLFLQEMSDFLVDNSLETSGQEPALIDNKNNMVQSSQKPVLLPKEAKAASSGDIGQMNNVKADSNVSMKRESGTSTKKLPCPVYTLPPEPPSDKSLCTRIQFRIMSDNSRLIHTFSKQATIHDLFQFVEYTLYQRSLPEETIPSFDLSFNGISLRPLHINTMKESLESTGLLNASLHVILLKDK